MIYIAAITLEHAAAGITGCTIKTAPAGRDGDLDALMDKLAAGFRGMS